MFKVILDIEMLNDWIWKSVTVKVMDVKYYHKSQTMCIIC